MDKIKVHELAKKIGVTSSDLISKLSEMGVTVKSHLSTLEDDVANKLSKVFDTKTKTEKQPHKEAVKQEPHIIRRQVKVIRTDDSGNEVQHITTKAHGEITTTNTIVTQNNKKEEYDKTGLGVITPKVNNNRPKYLNNRNANVVIMKNGKVVDEPVKEEVNEIKQEIVEEVKEEKVVENIVENKEEIKQPNLEQNNNRYNNQDRRPQGGYNRNNNNSGNNGGYNNQDRRPQGGYNRDNNNSGNNGGYNNQDRRPQGGYNRNNNNSGNNGGYNNQDRRPQGGYNRDNNNSGNNGGYNNQDRRPQGGFNRNNGNNGGYNNQDRRPQGGYNRNNNNNGNNGGYNNQDRRPQGGFNRNNGNNGGYNNQDRRPQGGFNRNNNNQMNNSSYQVNKFLKQDLAPGLEKETRDYKTTLIDKSKYHSEQSTASDNKKKNKNTIKDENTRVSLTRFKGLEVDSKGGLMDLYERDSDKVRTRRRKENKVKQELGQTLIIPMTEVELPEIMTVKYFAESIKKQSSEIIKKLFKLGVMATVNQEIDFDTAFLIAEEYGIKAEKEVVVTEEDILFDESDDDDKDLKPRPPIVVVMGHVDHGKTSILDRIRSESVQQGEAGGITQHIGAYMAEINNRQITFLDTPGHEAFTAMRARGAMLTDIAIIVVAADDGIMPQTVEAINHAKAANVSIIVAINKIDKPTANTDKVKQELLEAGLVPEEWGGDTICVPVSAMTGQGMDTLLEMILLVADMKDLKANPDKQSKGTVIEAKLDKTRGSVASVLVQRGTLNIGDTIVVGEIIGRIRAMTDYRGKKVKIAGPSTPVEIIGLPAVPQTGDIFYEVENEKVAKSLVEKRKADVRKNLIKQASKVTLDDLFSKIKDGEVKELNVIVKADVQGSVQAIKDSLEKLSNDEVRVKVIHGNTGGITETDVTLASVSNAIIIGFNVRPDSNAQKIAEKEKVDLRLYRVIYDAINDVEAAMKGMLAPTFKEVIHGNAEVRQTFKVSNVGTIAGCYVKSGKILRNSLVRVIRDSIVIAEDKIDSLKRMKDDAKEVAENYECGIKLDKFNDLKEGDIIECFEMQEEKRV